MFHIITAIISLYVFWRYIWPLPWSITPKIITAVLLLAIAEHHFVTRNFFGSMASPEIPPWMIMTLGWAFGAILLAAFFAVIRDLFGLLIAIFSLSTGKKMLRSRWLANTLGVAALLLSAFGVWEAVRIPEVKTVELAIPNLPPELDGFRLVQLTDLHASRLLQAPWVQAVVDKANALAPDLTVITGDLIDGTPQARTADVQPLAQLSARYGVFATPGNHEYYVEYLQWLPVFKQLGLQMLFNEHVSIEHNGQRLTLAGITDRTAAAFNQLTPDIHAALNQAPSTDPIILLSHRPTGAALNAQAGVDLQLSGHTHGGQILGPHILTQWANEGFVSGLYQVDQMQLYVSNGTGLWNGLPLRVGRPSEITLLILKHSH